MHVGVRSLRSPVLTPAPTNPEATNKFLRIYYGRVKEYLAKLEESSNPVSNEQHI